MLQLIIIVVSCINFVSDISCFGCQLLLFACFTAKVFLHGFHKSLVIIVSCSNIDSWPFQMSALVVVNFMESFSTAELFLHGVTNTCSFLDAHFYSKGVWEGIYVGGLENPDRIGRIFFWTGTSDLENFFMFCELTVFLCFKESNIVCGGGKGHTETISPSVLSVLVVFKDVVNNGRDLPGWTFLPYRPPVISQHWRDSIASSEGQGEGMKG